MKHKSMKALLKKENGITLIALVITIVILIILAGTLINVTLGNNGLFNRAKDAATKQKYAAAYEQVSIAYTETKLESMQDETINFASAMQSNLKKTDENATAIGTGTMNNLYGTYSGYKFTIVNGKVKLTEQGENRVFELGQEVTITTNGNTESFYVIDENDSASNDTITLITKYYLKKNANEQATEDTLDDELIEFCPEPDKPYYDYKAKSYGYWIEDGEFDEILDSEDGNVIDQTITEEYENKYPYSLNGVAHDNATVYNKAVAYGNTIGGSGRLLTLEEVNYFDSEEKIQGIIYGTILEHEGDYWYWLGTASNIREVYGVYGYYEKEYRT